jgi:hypothetical protein
MPTRPLLLLLLWLLFMLTSCTAFGPDGTIPMALHRDMVNRISDCPLSDEEWAEKCGNDFSSKTDEQKNLCPYKCRPRE